MSAERKVQVDEYLRLGLVAKEATHLAYREDNLHRAATEAVEKDMTLAEFELSAGAAYERARAYRALKSMSTGALRYLEILREKGSDTESAEATDAWYALSEEEQDSIDRYLNLEKDCQPGDPSANKLIYGHEDGNDATPAPNSLSAFAKAARDALTDKERAILDARLGKPKKVDK